MKALGAKTNLIPLQVVPSIQVQSAMLHITYLQSPAVYRGATEEHYVTCHKIVMLDAYLRMEHEFSLIIVNIAWLIPNEEILPSIIRRTDLVSLGSDNREILIAA